MDKAHLLIDANSSRVGLKRGQEWYAALGMNVARDCGDKGPEHSRGRGSQGVCRRLAVWSRNGPGSVRLARVTISGKSVDASSVRSPRREMADPEP
jgi:hypothetical protein